MKQFGMSSTLLCGALVVALVITLPFSASALTLTEAVQSAVESYPEVQAAAENSRAAHYRVREEQGRYFPNLDLEHRYGADYTSSPTTRFDQRGDDIVESSGTSLVLSQPIFDLTREFSIQNLQALKQSSRFFYLDTAEVIALEAVRGFLEVSRLVDVVAMTEENIKSHESILAAVRERAAAGSLGVGDVSQAEARLANAIARFTDSQRELENARFNFERFVGVPPGLEVMRPEFDESMLPAEVQAAVAMVENHPAVKAAGYDVKAAEASIHEALSQFLPTLDGEVSASRDFNNSGIQHRTDNVTAMLVVNWSIFDGGSKFFTVKKERRLAAAERANEEQLRREIIEQVRQSWNDIIRRDLEAKALNEQVVANSKVVQIYHEEFDLGLRDLLDLLDTEDNLINSQIVLINSESQAQYSRYRLLAAGGKLLSSLGVEPAPLDQ